MKLNRRRPRLDYRRRLASFVTGPGPFLSLYLDVGPGNARLGARDRLLRHLDDVVRAGHPLTPAQWTAAGEAIERIEDDDATLVSVIDADGLALTTGYPEPPKVDSVVVADLPRLGPLLEAEQRLIHHLVMVLEQDRLMLATVPRHGESAETVLEVQDRDSIPALVERAARASETALVVLCADQADLAWLEPKVRAGIPAEVPMSSIAIDDLDDSGLADQLVVELATQTARKTVELIRLWRFHEVHDQATSGAGETLAAITEGRAGLVLLNDDFEDQRVLWFDPSSGTVHQEEPTPVAGRTTLVARWQDVVIGAALVADVPLHIVPNLELTLQDGIGTILADRVEPQQLAAMLER